MKKEHKIEGTLWDLRHGDQWLWTLLVKLLLKVYEIRKQIPNSSVQSRAQNYKQHHNIAGECLPSPIFARTVLLRARTTTELFHPSKWATVWTLMSYDASHTNNLMYSVILVREKD